MHYSRDSVSVCVHALAYSRLLGLCSLACTIYHENNSEEACFSSPSSDTDQERDRQRELTL